MLDVHAPHEKIHGVSDFFLHLFTITVGLLIALGLEASVEAMHHRHQRKEAEILIQEEIEQNLNHLKESAAGVMQEKQGVKRILLTLEARSQGKTDVFHKEDFAFREAPTQDAAWRTANSTGAVAYMDYAEVERFSDAYKEQALLQTMEEQALDDYLQLEPILSLHGNDLSPETAREAIPYARRIYAHLQGMLDVGAGTIGSYEDVLKK